MGVEGTAKASELDVSRHFERTLAAVAAEDAQVKRTLYANRLQQQEAAVARQAAAERDAEAEKAAIEQLPTAFTLQGGGGGGNPATTKVMRAERDLYLDGGGVGGGDGGGDDGGDGGGGGGDRWQWWWDLLLPCVLPSPGHGRPTTATARACASHPRPS